MTPAKPVTITIREGCVVIIDGVPRNAGDTLQVPAKDADALTEQGVATR